MSHTARSRERAGTAFYIPADCVLPTFLSYHIHAFSHTPKCRFFLSHTYNRCLDNLSCTEGNDYLCISPKAISRAKSRFRYPIRRYPGASFSLTIKAIYYNSEYRTSRYPSQLFHFPIFSQTVLYCKCCAQNQCFPGSPALHTAYRGILKRASFRISSQ